MERDVERQRGAHERNERHNTVTGHMVLTHNDTNMTSIWEKAS